VTRPRLLDLCAGAEFIGAQFLDHLTREEATA
jgi:hypothetical protein